MMWEGVNSEECHAVRCTQFFKKRHKNIFLFSRKGAKGAKRYVLLFLCQKYSFTQNSQKYTEFAPQVFRHKNIRAYFVFT